jgi:hypothetical protein
VDRPPTAADQSVLPSCSAHSDRRKLWTAPVGLRRHCCGAAVRQRIAALRSAARLWAANGASITADDLCRTVHAGRPKRVSGPAATPRRCRTRLRSRAMGCSTCACPPCGICAHRRATSCSRPKMRSGLWCDRLSCADSTQPTSEYSTQTVLSLLVSTLRRQYSAY